MTSYLRKYVTALASAKDYVAHWSADRVYVDEALIVPFPTLAIFDQKTKAWTVNIKAWLYLPFQSRSIKNYLPTFLTGKGADGTKAMEYNVEKEEVAHADDKVDAKITVVPSGSTATQPAGHEDVHTNDDENDDMYEDALRE